VLKLSQFFLRCPDGYRNGDLQKRKSTWLRDAAKEMTKATERDWKKYRRQSK